MWFSTCSKWCVALAVLVPASVCAFTPPRIGHQHLTLGVVSEPGWAFDETAPVGTSTRAPVWSQRARLGFQHAVHTHFYASAEADLGMTYLRPSTLSASGRSDSELAFSWQTAVIGRFLPSGDDGGLTLGGAVSLMRASLDEAPLFIMGMDARVGWLSWTGTTFSMVEIGWVAPFIQGLAFPTDFGGKAQNAAQDWSVHRAFVAISVGF